MMGRPPGSVGRTQLKQEDLIRIQTLSRDAKMGPTEIRRITGYSIHQIKYALKKKTPTIGKRTGRPRKGEIPKKEGENEGGGPGEEGMNVDVDVDADAEESVSPKFQFGTFQAENPDGERYGSNPLS